MHCHTCGYALWNLTEPRCPECGAGFDLRQYRFVPGTVAFACPLCEALHRGSGPGCLPGTGATVRCQGCGELIETRRMRVVPLVDDPLTAVADPLPWADRARLGRWRAWWRTAAMGMVSPGRLGERIGLDGNFNDAFKFAMMTYGLGIGVQCVSIGIAISFVITALAKAHTAGHAADVLVPLGIMWAVMFVIVLMSATAGPLLVAGLQGGVGHLFLRLTGQVKRDFGITAQAVLYAQGPMFWMCVPLCGLYLGAVFQVWALVSSILALIPAQAVGGVRATLAMLWAPLVLALVIAMEVGW